MPLASLWRVGEDKRQAACSLLANRWQHLKRQAACGKGSGKPLTCMTPTIGLAIVQLSFISGRSSATAPLDWMIAVAEATVALN